MKSIQPPLPSRTAAPSLQNNRLWNARSKMPSRPPNNSTPPAPPSANHPRRKLFHLSSEIDALVEARIAEREAKAKAKLSHY